MNSNNDLQGKTASVVGIGISNIPLIDYLLAHGAKVTARDIKTREKLGSAADMLEQKGVRLLCGENYLEKIEDEFIFRTPGIRYDKPELKKAVEAGSVLTSEMELFFQRTPATIIGVTGSDGKTTTTTIIYKFLSETKKNVYVGGNIGRPLLPELEHMTRDDIAVVELSSFQLHTMKISPDIAVITNISPNHLDYHLSMNEYIEAKKNIFLHKRRNRRLILKYTDDITRGMAEDAREETEVVFFLSENGIHEKEGFIYYKDEPIISVSDILLPGKHNRENYMAAIGAVYPIVNKEEMKHIAQTFGGVEHRREFVCKKYGVSYYNSSIDSTPTRTTATLDSFSQKVIVICGGYDKHIPFKPLALPLCRKAKAVVLTGATAPEIKAVLDGCDDKPELHERLDFTEAVMTASSLASDGDIVLLSPACASFDSFPNFEARGNRFKEIVLGL